jgi:hypothetical protein
MTAEQLLVACALTCFNRLSGQVWMITGALWGRRPGWRLAATAAAQRRLSSLHGLVHHGQQLGRQGVQVDLLVQPITERGDRLGGVGATPDGEGCDEEVLQVPHGYLPGVPCGRRVQVPLPRAGCSSERARHPGHRRCWHANGTGSLRPSLSSHRRRRPARGRRLTNTQGPVGPQPWPHPRGHHRRTMTPGASFGCYEGGVSDRRRHLRQPARSIHRTSQ